MELELVSKDEREERQVHALLAQLEVAPRPVAAAGEAADLQGEPSTSAPRAPPAARRRGGGRAAAAGRTARKPGSRCCLS